MFRELFFFHQYVMFLILCTDVDLQIFIQTVSSLRVCWTVRVINKHVCARTRLASSLLFYNNIIDAHTLIILLLSAWAVYSMLSEQIPMIIACPCVAGCCGFQKKNYALLKHILYSLRFPVYLLMIVFRKCLVFNKSNLTHQIPMIRKNYFELSTDYFKLIKY